MIDRKRMTLADFDTMFSNVNYEDKAVYSHF